MSKKITVIPATGGAYRDLTIEPGTTPRDIKQTLALSNEHVLTQGRGAEPIPEDANLCETLADGAKIYSTTSVEWGTSFWGWIFDGPEPTPAPKRACVRVERAYVPAGSQPIRVQREPRPYWAERGWTRKGREYSGQYQTRFGNWYGWISESPGGRVETFISNPPLKLRKHPHWPCFRDRGNGWSFVHPVAEVPDASAAILAIEKTLRETFTRK